MLTPYRRHVAECRHFGKSQNYTNCQCPVWAYGSLAGRPYRKSQKTRDWSVAIRRLEKLEADPRIDVAVSIKKASTLYLEECAVRKLADSSIRSYRNVITPFVHFCEQREVRQMDELDLGTFREFRKVRGGTASTQRKEIEYLRTFCAFCMEHEWISKNFAKKVKPPADEGLPTMPFDREEVQVLLAACGCIDNANKSGIERARKRARALVLLMLYSGMRVSDCVKLERIRLQKDGRLLVRMMKTRQPLYVKLHKDCIEALAAVPVESKYFFWTGKSTLETAVKSARRTISCLRRMTKINAHPHRFRDTFAVELLLAGEEIRTVQLLLGHKSIKTTEKHYAPFVRRFQEKLDAATDKLDFS